MKLSKLEEIILNNASKVNINRAENILKENKMIKLNIHKVDNFYNIYGEFKSDSQIQSYSSHLRIDLKREVVSYSKCNCDIHKEGATNSKVYLCEHVVATGIRFINEIKKKVSKNITNEKVSVGDNIINRMKNLSSEYECNDKEKLDIEISIKGIENRDNKFFEVSFFIGNSKILPILNIEEVFKSIIDKKNYHIGKGLIYDPNKYYVTNSDEKLIEYVYEYILICPKQFNKNIITIPSYILDRFLFYLNDKKVKFTYKYQTYISKVMQRDLPLTFTLKKSNNEYVLTTRKVFPTPINEKNNVFLFDRNIYLPSLNQLNIYNLIFKELRDNKSIKFKNDINILMTLIKNLSEISNNIYYDEEVLNEIENEININFDFTEEKDKLCCNVTLFSSIGNINYKEAVEIQNEILAPVKKLRNIESVLNKNRFYFRRGVFEYLGSEDEYYEFLKHGLKDVESLGNTKLGSDSFKLKQLIFDNLELKEDRDKYYLSYKLQEINNNELKNIVKGYKENKTYLKLDDGSYVDLSTEEFKNILKLMESLNIDLIENKDAYEIELNKLYYLNEKIKDDNLSIKNKEHIQKVLTDINEKTKEDVYEVPKNLNATLRKYQEKGFIWLKNLKKLGLGGILCDEMGLGKTLQVITFLLSEKEQTNIQLMPTLIITPTSLIYNWKEEFIKFAPSLKVGIIHGKEKERDTIFRNIQEYDIVLTTYGLVRSNYEKYEEIKFENIILDEGHNINNYKAQISIAVKKLNSQNRFILTGTPIENSLNELWSLFDFVLPGYLNSVEKFNERFINNEENKEDLKLLISPYILRRLKNDVITELPSKIEKKYFIENTEEQTKIYNGFVNKIKTDIVSGSISIFLYLTKLRQICLDPSLLLPDYEGGSGKIDFVKEYIKQNNKEHKILLFSQFTSVLKKIENILNQENIEYLYLDGSTSAKHRISMVDEFNNKNEKRIFLISLKAGGTGLNLTSADIVIHFDPWWNPSIEDQATDRAHRIGQQKNVEVIKLIAKNTIEEKILMLQEDKTELINDIITNELNDSNIINKLNNKELLKLI